MTKTLTQVAAVAFAAVLSAATFAGANGLANQAYVKADAVAMSQAHVQVLAAQTVVVVGHRV